MGYEKIIEWAETALTPSVRTEVKQIVEQYISVLRRKVMGYPQEVIELCNKIYQKHREAIDLINEVVGSDDSGFSELKIWAEEWEANKHINQAYIQNNRLIFRTAGLDELFPINKEKWPCYYMIQYLPHPNSLTIEFASFGMNKKYNDRFIKVKAQFNQKKLKDNWQFHRIKTWKLRDYDPDQTEDFEMVADALKSELERLIFIEIPKLEAEMRDSIKEE